MKQMTRRTLKTALLPGAVMCALLSHGAAAHAAGTAAKLQGTWINQVSASDCGFEQLTGLTFFSLTSFNEGGTTLFAPSSPFPSQRTPVVGAWEKVGDHTYKSLGVTFLFNAQGVFDGSQKIANTWQLNTNGDELTGTTVSEWFNTSDEFVRRVCATVVGTRIHVE